jgi:hypothetical protein
MFLCGQKTHFTKGKSQVRMESNMTKDQSRDRAEELAKINAIENAFGTFVEQNTDIKVDNGAVTYNIIGSTKVKGEWIKTTRKEFKEDIQEQLDNTQHKEKFIWISCSVEGEVRPVSSKAMLDCKLLRCPKLECETNSFVTSQGLILYFRSPIDGYLSVFIDEGNEVTRRLFPYLNQGNESAVKIEGDKSYYLFTNLDGCNRFTTKADEIELFTQKLIEYNHVFIVFSPTTYVKPILSDAQMLEKGYILPKEMPTSKFQEWISECKVAMPDFQVKQIKFSISKP